MILRLLVSPPVPSRTVIVCVYGNRLEINTGMSPAYCVESTEITEVLGETIIGIDDIRTRTLMSCGKLHSDRNPIVRD